MTQSGCALVSAALVAMRVTDESARAVWQQILAISEQAAASNGALERDNKLRKNERITICTEQKTSTG